MKFRNLLFILLFLSFGTALFAQEKEEVKKESKSVFSLDGEFRNRFELSPSQLGRNVLVPENTPAGATFWQRSRLNLSYKNDKFESKFSIQDVRPFVANDQGWLSNNGTTLSLHVAWGKYYFVKNENRDFGIKIGRQELRNSDARLIWHRNWNHYSAAYDAIAFEGNNKDLDLKWKLAFSMNSDEALGTATKYRTLGSFNLTKKFGKTFTFNFADLMTGFDEASGLSTANYVRNTVGINPVFKMSGFTFNGSFYYQHGTPNTFIGDNPNPVTIAAMMYTANVKYKIGNITIGAGYDNYSGEAYDDDGSDYKDKEFSAPYAAGHKFFGNTDFHLKLFGKGRGLQDINGKVNVKFNKKTSVGFGFHMITFAEMNAYTDVLSGELVEFTSVGNNIDFTITHTLGKKMSVLAGYSALLPSDDFRKYNFGGNDLTSKFHGWGWVMFTFQPNFLKVVK